MSALARRSPVSDPGWSPSHGEIGCYGLLICLVMRSMLAAPRRGGASTLQGGFKNGSGTALFDDAQRPVIWNIGAIAASGRPGAVELVRQILLASAAIPAAFPPVLIDVEVDGKPYQEMHVDGGAIAQTSSTRPPLRRASISGTDRSHASAMPTSSETAASTRNGRLPTAASSRSPPVPSPQ
jgi:hypothetical protein